MGLYRIRISTGDSMNAGSKNEVYLWLVGQHGEASLGKLLRPCRNSVSCAELGAELPGEAAGLRGKVREIPRSPDAGAGWGRWPLTLRKALTASESGKGAQRHLVSVQ